MPWPSRGRAAGARSPPDDDGAGRNEVARVEAVVRGRVQGVGFRYFAWQAAQDLDLEGWVANEPDGSLRCLVQGPRDRVEALIVRLEAGPARRDPSSA